MIASSKKFLQETESENKPTVDKLLKDVPFDKYYEWFEKKHVETAFVDGYSIKHTTKYSDGMMKRIYNARILKTIISPNIIHSSVIVCKLFDGKNNKETNFATIICEHISDLPETFKNMINPAQIIGKVAILYYSAFPSLISCDGEYRAGLTRYSELLSAKILYRDVWDEIEAYIIPAMNRRRWSIYPAYFHGRNTENNFELEKIIKTDLIVQTMFALCWFQTMYKEYLGYSETHMNASFREVFLKNSTIDLEFIEELVKKYQKTINDFYDLTSSLTHKIMGTTKYKNIPVGYKTIPLNVRELQNIGQIKHKPWKEHLIASLCNNLIINQIAPNFPITLDWFVINNTKKGLFDNKSQYEKLKHSELAKIILNLLREAQRGTYFATNDLVMRQTPSDSIKQWISTKFKRLNEKIKDPIEFSISEIIMSDISIGYPSEYVGKTVSDIINLIDKNKEYNNKLDKPFEQYHIFCKYMFEICYGLLAVNKKLGVIHGDFHLNNATIGPLYTKPETKSKVLYRIDESHSYLFENNKYFACVIDFSRAILNPENHEIFQDLSLPSTMKAINDYDSFENGEVSNLLNLYLQLFPNKMTNRDSLKVIFKNNISSVFKLMTAVDIYMFSMRLSALLNLQKYKVNKKCYELLDKIIKMSETFIATDINKIIQDPGYAKQVEADVFPMEAIIKKCFQEFLDHGDKKEIVSDYYNIENEMKYSLAKYDLYPDVFKYSRYYDDKGKEINISIINNAREKHIVTNEKRRMHGLEHLKFIALKTLENDVY